MSSEGIGREFESHPKHHYIYALSGEIIFMCKASSLREADTLLRDAKGIIAAKVPMLAVDVFY